MHRRRHGRARGPAIRIGLAASWPRRPRRCTKRCRVQRLPLHATPSSLDGQAGDAPRAHRSHAAAFDPLQRTVPRLTPSACLSVDATPTVVDPVMAAARDRPPRSARSRESSEGVERGQDPISDHPSIHPLTPPNSLDTTPSQYHATAVSDDDLERRWNRQSWYRRPEGGWDWALLQCYLMMLLMAAIPVLMVVFGR